MNEEVQAGVEMKVKTPQEMIEDVQSMDEVSHEGERPVFKFKRSDKGLIFSSDDDAKEVSSPFELLEPGDDVNHQIVEAVEQDEQGNYKVHLDYFGVKTVLDSPDDVFSIFLKEQRDLFKRTITDYVESFEGKFLPEYLLSNIDVLLMAMELLCARVDMNTIDGFIVGNEGVDLAIASLLGLTLRKPVYIVERGKKFEPDHQMNVILFTESYVRRAVDDALEILGNETQFYISYQLSLFDTDYINGQTEAKIIDDSVRDDLERSNDQIIIGGNI